ncbi:MULTISPECIES: asparaginase [Nonlabens]|uniref:asparaginase n=1 Tax=Nonlabens TaxID=363408 RepID=UPI000CF54CAA|nr:asparaginase [Nonlabens tegetincola]PQJ19049.1 L-asparaginase 1 [Nonlabens tegetincola]
MKPNILLIYTGGTIGMMKDIKTGALKAFDFDKLLYHIPELKQLDCTIETISFETPIDSSDMNTEEWRLIGDMIYDRYDNYDGFVVLHGSDTMSFTGSALSFMFENLTKPVILTGSQLPIGDLRTDAKENLITSIQIATLRKKKKPLIREVCIYFEYQLYRANRTAKMNAEHFEAFSSPNFPPLAISGVHLNVDEDLLWKGYKNREVQVHRVIPRSDDRMHYRPQMIADVVVLKLFPGITETTVQAICNIPNLKGIILETYGSGNAPTKSWFIDAMKDCLSKDIRIVNVTQCRGGSVDMGKYETSRALKEMGMISGKDLTTEAALAKMMYLLAYIEDDLMFKDCFETSLRGEITN